MNKEEWNKVEEELKHFYNPIKLNCDGYEITIILQQLKPMKNGIVLYVNGEIHGKWIIEDCEERRRFFRPIKKSVLKGKQKEFFMKVYRTKKQRQEFEEKNKYTAYSYIWTSFRSLKRHLINNNKEIKRIV